jgi:hypothetical protein
MVVLIHGVMEVLHLLDGLNTGRRCIVGWGTVNNTYANSGVGSPAVGNYTENYDGTSWTNCSNSTHARSAATAFGEGDLGIVLGQNNSTEHYDGSTDTWSDGGTAPVRWFKYWKKMHCRMGYSK